MTVEITRAGSDRVAELTALIGRAFSDDPIAMWALAPAATEERIRLWFLWIDELFARSAQTRHPREAIRDPLDHPEDRG